MAHRLLGAFLCLSTAALWIHASPEPALTDPAPNSTLYATSVDFAWHQGAYEQFNLDLGTTLGGYDLGYSQPTSDDHWTKTGLPDDGSTIYARLWYKNDSDSCSLYSTCPYKDYLYTAHFGLHSPAPKSALTGSQTTFEWNAHDNATQYAIDLGDTGVGSYNIAWGSTVSTSWQNPASKPIARDGRVIFVRLWYKPATESCSLYSSCPYIDYIYYAEFNGMVSPVAGSTLSSPRAIFKWSGHFAADRYGISVGDTTVGSSNLAVGTSAGSSWKNPSNRPIPQDGRTIYTRLHHKPTGSDCLLFASCPYYDYTYTANTVTTPAIKHSVTFDWAAIPQSYIYNINVGSWAGAGNYCSSTISGSTIFSCDNIPPDVDRVYLRLTYRKSSGAFISERQQDYLIFPTVDRVGQTFYFDIQ